MKLTKDKTGCVIDVPCKYDEFIEDTWQDSKTMKLFKMTEIPDLEDYDPRRRFGGGGDNRNGGGRNGYHNNRGGGQGRTSNGGGFKRKQDFGNGGGFKRTRQF